MKIPQTPKSLHEHIGTLDKPEDGHKYIMNIYSNATKVVDSEGRYAHWDKLQYRPVPDGVDSPLDYWYMLKAARSIGKKGTVFKDKKESLFSYVEFDRLNELKDWVVEHAAGALNAPSQIKDKSTKSKYLISSIIEEAISSSKMEGASTTRRVAKDMLRSGREPKDVSEKMIFNNYQAMNFIRYMLKDGDIKLTPKIIFKLHDIVTEGTLTGEDEGKGGVLRGAGDNIVVCDPRSEEILHTPPSFKSLPERLQLICDFVNGDTDEDGTYIPPVIRAIITHFMIGYDHPFVEGNGRTARALFYWVMIKNNYWLMEYVSISAVIKRSQNDYLKAYIHTESDENDLTYFILQQLEVIKQAVTDFHEHVLIQVQKDNDVLELFKGSSIRKELNLRQVALIRNALKHAGNTYTVLSHKTSHGCSKEASRKDLLKMADVYGLLNKFKDGRTLVFIAPNDIVERIKNYKVE